MNGFIQGIIIAIISSIGPSVIAGSVFLFRYLTRIHTEVSRIGGKFDAVLTVVGRNPEIMQLINAELGKATFGPAVKG